MLIARAELSCRARVARRSGRQRDVRERATDLILATPAFGLGVDKPDIRLLGVLTFVSADDFLLRASRLSKSTPIFLDFNLDDNLTAQNCLPEMRRLGFSEIVLVTSHRDLKKEDFVGTKAIIGKNPEFAERFLPPPEFDPPGTAISSI
jgi:hypothetical protein